MATMTRKEFVLQVTEALQANPRAILAGHGIPAAVLKLIATRPDVIAKLAVILWSTKYFKKGAKGLKKAMNFKISGYKNFQDFNKRARTDVENFMTGLSPEDQSKFTNNESILTLIMLPDNASGEEATDIAFGKSIAIGFDKAVKKEYKIPGGIYVTIMWGDSVIRPVEEKKAAVKSKINTRKQAKRTPAKVKMELTRKAKAKLEKLKLENEKLQGKRKKNELELEQIHNFAGHLGVKAKTERDLIGGIKGYSGEMRGLVAKLSGPKKLLFKKAVALVRAGDKAGAEEILNKINVKRITDLVLNRQGMTQISKVQEARIKAMRKEIKILSRSNEKLLVDMSLAPTASLKSSVRQKMKRQIARINELKAKLKVYEKSFTISGVRNKAKMISETNKRIEANLAKGQSITLSLANAIASLDASDSEKQEIKEAIMVEVAEGTPIQFAVQSAVQQAIQQIPAQQMPVQAPVVQQAAQQYLPEETGLTEASLSDVISQVTNSIDIDNIDDIELDEVIDEALSDLGIDGTDVMDIGVGVKDYLTDFFVTPVEEVSSEEEIESIGDTTQLDQYVEEVPELADVLADISGDTDVDFDDIEALEDLIYNVLESYDLNETTFSDGIELSDFVYDYFDIPEDTSGGEDITGEIDLNADGTPINGFERDKNNLVGNAFNDYTRYNEPEDRPSEDEIMSYFVDVCNQAGVEASEMTAAYDVYRDNVENYMATSVDAPSSQDNFGGENDFDTSMVGNSTIDDILAML